MGVRKKVEGIEVEPPRPKNNSSGCKLDDDAGYTFSGTPSLTATLLISASKHRKDTIERTQWHLPAIRSNAILEPPPGW